MKKKLLAGIIAIGLIAGLSGCKFSVNTKTSTEASTVTTTEATEDLSTDFTDEPSTEDSYDDTNKEIFNNVVYALPDGWAYNSEVNGTRLYKKSDGTESFSIYVQNETDYTADDLTKAYEDLIFKTFGSDTSTYTNYPITAGGRDWSVYSYGEGNLLSSKAYTDIYLFTDGFTTIYIENSYLADSFPSGEVLDILESIDITN